ncbi:hypothetical protein E4U43_007606 [Claviceps pusilla]|uniref:Zn(2)-C6 fungal-type domain-containing protein n=1 Tax=Claviceps pusilla TaxID=123648 RepID=A0A9P7NCJ3_9HYPO|nr:hypothetical protein E4U43_007606 [Claviceps pusilla]
MAPSATKKPRLRVFAPKVRTGCVTCKKRRKKCDEEKPVCRRCRDEDYVCDGYAHTVAVNNKQQNRSKSHCLTAHPRTVLFSQKLPGNAFEHYFLHHFFTFTIHDMMDLPKATTFWTTTLVTLQQHNSYIQPAITALGAAHWLFLAGPGKTNHLQKFVVDQYNQAIASLIPSMETVRSSDMEPILACCLLFVCLESLRGNQSQAIRHLEAGSRLFGEHLQLKNSAPALQWLAAMFQSLGNQAALFAERQILQDLTLFLPAPDTDPSRAFTHLDEANEALDRLDSSFNRICWDCPANCDDLPKCPDNCGCEACLEWKAFENQVATFSMQFQPLARRIEATGDLAQRQRLLRLQLVEKAWQVIVDDSDSCDAHFKPQHSDELLDLIERNLQLAASRPTFSLSADIIPAVIDVYDYSPSAERRRKAINLLRSYQLREVVFTSQQVADFLEDHFSKLCLGDTKPEYPDQDSAASKDLVTLDRLPHTPSLRSQMWEFSSAMTAYI